MPCAADRKQNSAVVKTFVNKAPRSLLASKEGVVSEKCFFFFLYKQSIITCSKGLPILKIEMHVLSTQQRRTQKLKTANRRYCWSNPNFRFFIVSIQIFCLEVHLCRSFIYFHSHMLTEKPFKVPCTPIFNTAVRLFQLY